MNWILTYTFILISTALTCAQNPFEGVWLTQNKLGRISVKHVGQGVYSGKLVWIKSTVPNGQAILDINNDDEKLRQRKLLGLELFKNVKSIDSQKIKGQIYDPYRGKTFTCEIWPESEDVLNIKAYWGILHQTIQWQRVK